MRRRDFFKALSLPAFSFLGLKLAGCGRIPEASGSDGLALKERFDRLGSLRVWAYYVPLTSYDGIIEEFEGRNELDRKVLYDEVIKETSRINGRETDGTTNTSLNVDELTEEYLRVHFWHDDNGGNRECHSLFVFKRYLTELEAGNKVFVATGIFQGHFHVVMIEPQSV
jgi:hypothetical protein